MLRGSKARRLPCGVTHENVAFVQGMLPRGDGRRLSVRTANALDRARSDRIAVVRESAKQALAVLDDVQVLTSHGHTVTLCVHACIIDRSLSGSRL